MCLHVHVHLRASTQELMWEVCKTDPLIKEGASEEEPEVRRAYAHGCACVHAQPIL